MTPQKSNILFYTGIITAVWFALTGMVWTYGAALVIAYPFGALSLMMWLSVRKEKRARNKYILIILGIGLLLSLAVLIGMLVFN